MSFRRNKNIMPISASISTPIIAFGDTLSKIANATVNLEDDLKNAATLLNISSITLSKMLLSTDPNQIQCITLIRNLSESLKEYPDGTLPEQLSQYIIQLNQHMLDNPILEDYVPAFFELICPTIHHPIINILQFDEFDENLNNFDDEYLNNFDDEQINNFDDENKEVFLINVSEQNLKEDLCVICFLNLNQEPDVVETICKHQYHNNCISQWIRIKRCCPLCNGNL